MMNCKNYQHLPHLKVLDLYGMDNLVSTPDFDGLPSLQKLQIICCDKLEEIHPSLGNHKSVKYIELICSNLKKFPKIDHMKKLENLLIDSDYYDVEIPEIQSYMENLAHLSLSGSRQVAFLSSVAVHTMLVHLELWYCDWIENFPELPSSLVIFKAHGCKRLTSIGDVYRNCKWLCQVSILGVGILNDGDRLLQSMLQGKAIENHSMVLELEGLQIPRQFRPRRLRDGCKCTLQLPENWCNDFCGFLMCAVIKNESLIWLGSPKISMKPVRGGSMGIDSEDDVDWKESVKDKQTWVGYVSFCFM